MAKQLPINIMLETWSPGYMSSQDSLTAPVRVYPNNQVSKTVTVVKTPAWSPNYSESLRNGTRLAPLPFAHSRITRTHPKGLFRETRTGMDDSVWPARGPFTYTYLVQEGVLSWLYGNAPTVGSGYLTDRLDREARLELLLKLKDSKANLVQSLAERKQLQTMIGGVTMKIAETLHHLRRGNLLGAASTLGLTVGKRAAQRYRKKHRGIKTRDDLDRVLSSGILTVQYGIRPLLSDVRGAAETFFQKRLRDIDETTLKVRKNGSAEDHWSRFDAPGTVSKRSTSVQATVKYGVTYAMGDEIIHTLAQIGISNPFLVAWELLPWSFVIDWFIPIGKYLEACDATNGLSFVDGYKSVKLVYREIDSQNTAYANSYGGHTTGAIKASFTQESFSRIAINGFPEVPFPSFRNPFSWEHALNGIALLTQFKKTTYRGLPG